jgi:hypothetical protein
MEAAMSKYAPLGEFLRAQRADEVEMSFADIERVTRVKLPDRAQMLRAWWSNNPSNNVMTKVWLDAGFKTERVDLSRRRLVFRRARMEGATLPAAGAGSRGPQPNRVSERGEHPLFGALKGLIVFVPGVDLTEPADPEWGDIANGDRD